MLPLYYIGATKRVVLAQKENFFGYFSGEPRGLGIGAAQTLGEQWPELESGGLPCRQRLG
jgi:hypothetical protein